MRHEDKNRADQSVIAKHEVVEKKEPVVEVKGQP